MNKDHTTGAIHVRLLVGVSTLCRSCTFAHWRFCTLSVLYLCSLAFLRFVVIVLFLISVSTLCRSCTFAHRRFYTLSVLYLCSSAFLHFVGLVPLLIGVSTLCRSCTFAHRRSMHCHLIPFLLVLPFRVCFSIHYQPYSVQYLPHLYLYSALLLS
jgi:hypothetical protein